MTSEVNRRPQRTFLAIVEKRQKQPGGGRGGILGVWVGREFEPRPGYVTLLDEDKTSTSLGAQKDGTKVG